jgi:hypothetical protein
MGKTALLIALADAAQKAGYVYVRTACKTNMLNDIIEKIQLNGAKLINEGPKTKIKGFNVGAVGFSFGLTFTDQVKQDYSFTPKLSLLCDRLAQFDKGVLILVDEIQPNMDVLRELALTYQELVGEGKNIAICMAGLPSATSSVLNDQVLTFLNRAQKIAVGAISLRDVRVYYSAAFAQLGIDLSPDLVEKAARATYGFPYLMQLVGYYIEQYSGVGGVSAASLEGVVDRAIADACFDLGSDIFAPTLNPLSAEDVNFLRAMAKDDGNSKVADLAKRLKKSQGYIQTYRKRLLDTGIIEAPIRGEVAFVLPYMRQYLRTLD